MIGSNAPKNIPTHFALLLVVIEGEGSYSYYGNEYKGEFRGAKRQGEGVIEFSQGGRLKSQWTHNLPSVYGELGERPHHAFPFRFIS